MALTAADEIKRRQVQSGLHNSKDCEFSKCLKSQLRNVPNESTI
jgi:hypothetical protein